MRLPALRPRRSEQYLSLLRNLKRNDDAIGAFDEVVEKYTDEESPRVQAWVACSLSSKAEILSELGQRREALAVCDELDRRFGGTKDPDLLDELERAAKVRASRAKPRSHRGDGSSLTNTGARLDEDAGSVARK